MSEAKKFAVEVVRIDEYKIEFNTLGKGAQVDEVWMKEWTESYYDFDTIERHARHLAQLCARFGKQVFIEGYGYVAWNGECLDEHYNPVEPMTDVNIIVVSEDQECEMDATEYA